MLDSAGLCYYLIPWPGPQTMFLILIREELLTIEMQSSPKCKIGTHDNISTQIHIKNASVKPQALYNGYE